MYLFTMATARLDGSQAPIRDRVQSMNVHRNAVNAVAIPTASTLRTTPCRLPELIVPCIMSPADAQTTTSIQITTAIAWLRLPSQSQQMHIANSKVGFL